MTAESPAQQIEYVYATPPAGDDRRTLWVELFGTPVLPITTAVPQVLMHNGMTLPPMYLVAVRHLAPDQFAQFLRFCEGRFPAAMVEQFVTGGFAVLAEGIVVIRSERYLFAT